VDLPEAAGQSFWLHGAAWQFPDYENADTFVDRLVREGLLVREPVVEAALQGQYREFSVRTIQRRFLRTTGLTHTAIYQIERARYATTLLQQGVSILDSVEEAGYFDQSHLTRALKRLIGQTPAQLVGKKGSEQLSFLYKTAPLR
jgi:methylphosphotriester-DNA--protein-cysteine methyltransferase